MPAAQKMTDVSLSIFRSKFKKTRIQMIDYTVRDSRIGFDPEEAFRGRGLGLTSMRERKLVDGKLTIELHLGSGTLIRSSVPLPARTAFAQAARYNLLCPSIFWDRVAARCGGSQCAASYGSHMPYQLSIHGLANLEQ